MISRILNCIFNYICFALIMYVPISAHGETNNCFAGQKKTGAFQLLQDSKIKLCCGNSSEMGTGAVRGIYPEIEYKTCVEKCNPPEKKQSNLEAAGSCIVNLVKEAMKTLWANLTSIFTLPMELWSAKSQIWQLMTNSEARAAFAKKIFAAVEKFITDRVNALGSCLNEDERTQLYCKVAGQVVGEMATPTAITKLFQLAKNAVKGADLIAESLGKTTRGKELLQGMDKAQKKSEEALAKIGAEEKKIANIESAEKAQASRKGKAQSERSKKAVDSVMSQQRYSGKNLEKAVHENAALSDADRAKAIKADFPNLSDKQVEGIVKEVHTIGAQRAGSGVYKYTDAEIMAKMKKMKELGIEADDRRAILSLGYAGELKDEGNLFKALVEKQRKVEPLETPSVQTVAATEKVSLGQRLEAAKADYEASARDPERKMKLRDEISELERDYNKEQIESFAKHDSESFGDMLARMDREKPLSSAIPTNTIAANNSPGAITFSSEKVSQLKTYGKSDFEISLAQSEMKTGKKVYFDDGKRGLTSGTLKSADPDVPGNVLLEIKTADSNGAAKTISVPQVKVAVSDKDLLKLNSNTAESHASIDGSSDFKNLISGKSKTSSGDAGKVDNDKIVNEMIHSSMDAAKGRDEILAREKQINVLRSKIGHGAEFDSRVMKIQAEIDTIKYKSSPLNEFEKLRFKALNEIPTNVVEFSPQEIGLIKDLQKIRNEKKWFNNEDQKIFQIMDEVESRPKKNRQSQLSQADIQGGRLGIGRSDYNHYNANVKEQVQMFAKEMNGNFKKYDAVFSRLFKTQPSRTYYNYSPLDKDFDLARSFYQEYSKKTDNGPGVESMLQRVKLYVDSYQNQIWLNKNGN